MSSTHEDLLVDEDLICTIDVKTRQIVNSSPKNTLVQYDHNSERISFKIPKYIDGHNMFLTDRVTVIYENGTSRGSYTVTDVTEITDDETVLFTWLICGDATINLGALTFSINFRCFDADGNVTYNWSTRTCNIFTIVEGGCSDLTEYLPKNYNDILAVQDKKINEALANLSFQRYEYIDNTTEEMQELRANTILIFQNPVKILTLTLPTDYKPGDEFNFTFITDHDGCTLTLPENIKWDGSHTPILDELYTYYEVSILNDVAMISKGVVIK